VLYVIADRLTILAEVEHHILGIFAGPPSRQ
jgi:hypothetical protein